MKWKKVSFHIHNAVLRMWNRLKIKTVNKDIKRYIPEIVYKIMCIIMTWACYSTESDPTSMWLAPEFLYHQIKIPKTVIKWCSASGQHQKSIYSYKMILMYTIAYVELFLNIYLWLSERWTDHRPKPAWQPVAEWIFSSEVCWLLFS